MAKFLFLCDENVPFSPIIERYVRPSASYSFLFLLPIYSHVKKVLLYAS